MKILFIHNDYAKYSGEEHACEAIAALLSSHGHEIVWYRRSSAEIAGSTLGYAKAFITALHNPVAVKAVKQLVEKEKPDLAFIQNLFPLISPSVLGVLQKMGVPVVMRCPNYRLLCPNGLMFSHGEVCEKCLGNGRELWCVLRNCEGSMPKSIGYALRHAVARLRGAIRNNVDTFIVLSKFQKKYFVNEGIAVDQLSIVPNMIPAENGASHSLSSPKGIVGFVGRIAEEKGFGDFVEAARRLPHLKFAAAGSVKEGYDIGTLPANLKMRGFLSGTIFDEFVAEMQMLVTCSNWYEGFPNTIAQAMSAGLPVVATSIGVIPEVVDNDQTGLLYDPGNVDLLVQNIKRLADDADMRHSMGEIGRKKALSHYSHEAVYEALMVAFESARGKP